MHEGTLGDSMQADFSPLHSPKSVVISPPTSPSSTISSIDPLCTSPESQSPSTQGSVETATLQAVVYLPEPQEDTHTQLPHVHTQLPHVHTQLPHAHTPAPQDIIHTQAPQNVLHTVSHPSTALGTSTPGTSGTPQDKKRKLADSGDSSGKIVETVNKRRNTEDAFIQNKLEKKSGKHDFVISSVESFLNTFPISDSLKMEFGSKVVLLLHEYMQKYSETKQD